MIGPTQSPTDDTAPDPAEIDLEEVKVHLEVRSPLMSDSVALIAAVEALRDQVGGLNIDLVNSGHDNEALRERVAEGEAKKWNVQHSDTMNDMVALGIDRDSWSNRAESAEAHAVELAGALSDLIADLKDRATWMNFEPSKDGLTVPCGAGAFAHAINALAATTPEALERSRARDEVVKWARLVLVDHSMIGTMNHALAKLDALQGEPTP